MGYTRTNGESTIMLAPFSFFMPLNGKEELSMMIFILWLLLCMLIWTAIKTVASWAIVPQ